MAPPIYTPTSTNLKAGRIAKRILLALTEQEVTALATLKATAEKDTLTMTETAVIRRAIRFYSTYLRKQPATSRGQEVRRMQKGTYADVYSR